MVLKVFRAGIFLNYRFYTSTVRVCMRQAQSVGKLFYNSVVIVTGGSHY